MRNFLDNHDVTEKYRAKMMDWMIEVLNLSKQKEDTVFKAFYVMATGPGQGFESASLRAISVPMLFDTAEQDGVLAPGPNSTWLAAAIPKAREIKRNVGHFAYVLVCRPIIGSVLARGLGLPLCDDPSGTDRAADQERIRADAVQFFNAELRLESKSL